MAQNREFKPKVTDEDVYNRLGQILDRLDQLVSLTERAYAMFDNPVGRYIAKKKGTPNHVQLRGPKP